MGFEKVKLMVGFDQREAIAYHVFCQSVIERASLPVQILPLAIHSLSAYQEAHEDGSNHFVYTRFLCPSLMDYSGWVIYADGDMVCLADIAELWALRNPSKAVMVVKHDYKTKAAVKYFGNKNRDYPRKNWSSLILWNCGHPDNRMLTPDLVSKSTGDFLHRFKWLDDAVIGELPVNWNWLASEYPPDPRAKLIHYTLGTPCLEDYRNCEMAEQWHQAFKRTLEGMGG
ncbi:MAG: glycosyltransferase [Rhodocyclaceae bacterium]|nr:glycosyltransferase [Rhodocyclaceae bacterium]